MGDQKDSPCVRRWKRHPRPRMLLKLAVFVLLGAIVNVAVAWGCAYWIAPRPSSDFVMFDLGEDRVCGGYFGSRAGVSSIHWAKNFSRRQQAAMPLLHALVLPPNWSRFHDCLGPLVGDTSDYLEEARGWPAHSMSYGTSFANHELTGAPLRSPIVVHGLSLGNWPAGECYYGTVPKALPLRPIRFGFAINTIFYAAILWLLFYSPGKVRRFVIVRSRVRRHRCPACGFIIAPNTCAASGGPCSECGATLPWMTKAPS